MTDGNKAFTFAAKRAAGEKVIDTFDIDGESYDIRALKNSSVALLVHRVRSGRPEVVLSSCLDFAEKALTPESAKRFADRCLDPVEGLELEQITEVFEYILGIVSAGPTGQPSASSAPRRKTGTASPRGAAR